MYAVCAFFFLMSRDLKKGARIYPLCIIAILFLLTTGYVVEMLFAAKKNGGDQRYSGNLRRVSA